MTIEARGIADKGCSLNRRRWRADGARGDAGSQEHHRGRAGKTCAQPRPDHSCEMTQAFEFLEVRWPVIHARMGLRQEHPIKAEVERRRVAVGEIVTVGVRHKGGDGNPVVTRSQIRGGLDNVGAIRRIEHRESQEAVRQPQGVRQYGHGGGIPVHHNQTGHS